MELLGRLLHKQLLLGARSQLRKENLFPDQPAFSFPLTSELNCCKDRGKKNQLPYIIQAVIIKFKIGNGPMWLYRFGFWLVTNVNDISWLPRSPVSSPTAWPLRWNSQNHGAGEGGARNYQMGVCVWLYAHKILRS